MAITASEARKKLFPLIERVNDDRTPIEITSRRGDAVLMSRAEYDALRDPTTGVGKPEPLWHLLSGTWSRRISEEHRLVSLVDGDDLVILQARYHYA